MVEIRAVPGTDPENQTGAMKNVILALSLVYAAGSAGGLINSLAVWLLGVSGATAALGVNIAPSLSAAWLYPRLVWGGLWGFLFLIPFLGNSPALRGAICSLGPTLAQLFIVFPFKDGKGMMGMDLGALTPLPVIAANVVWGVVSSYWLAWIEGRTKILFVPSSMLLAMSIRGGSKRH
jgi:hypothetical protein